MVSYTPRWIRARVGPSAGLHSMGNSLYFRDQISVFRVSRSWLRVTVLSGCLAQEMAAERYRDSVDDSLVLGCLVFVGYRRSFPGVKGQRLDADHSSSSGTEVKNGWSFTSAPPNYGFMFFLPFMTLCQWVTAFRRFDTP